LPVTFTLASSPGRKFTGRLVELDRTTRALDHSTRVTTARVRIDGPPVSNPSSGGTARARIDCGKRPIGYVWFRDVIDVVHGEILFWL
jgi:hypothetical protein